MLKSLIFLITLLTLCLITLIESQSMKCDYLVEYFYPFNTEETNPSYGCSLETNGSVSEYHHQEITGQHEAERTDADVKALFVARDESLSYFSSIFCKKFQNLLTMILDSETVDSINGNALYECKNLDFFAFRSKKLVALPENLLIQNPKLTYIALSLFQMTAIPEKFFQNQKEVEILNLKRNFNLKSLPSNIFESLEKLTKLYLQKTNLQFINPKWFKNLRFLQKITISESPITEIPSQAFSTAVNLEELDLSENKIRTLKSDSFYGLEKLTKLYLQDNEISGLPRGVFVPLRNLEFLTVDNNNLTEIHSDSFGTYNLWAEISLQNNRITSIDEKFIDNYAKIRINMDKLICEEFVNWKASAEVLRTKLSTCFKNYRPRNE